MSPAGSNVLVGRRVVLFDFGVAQRMQEGVQLNKAGLELLQLSALNAHAWQVCESFRYMAPEVFARSR